MKKAYSVTEAKRNFSRLLKRTAAGKEIVITKRGVPVAQLIPVQAQKAKRELGFYKGLIKIPDDFDAPLPDEILDAFEGRTRGKKKRT